MRHRGSKKHNQQHRRGEGRESSSESDWRQQVWRRGYQGPISPWNNPFWPAWSQRSSAAADYYPDWHTQNQNTGRKRARPQSADAPRSDGWNRQKRSRWGPPEPSWHATEVPEAPEEEAAVTDGQDDHADNAGHWDYEESQQPPAAPKRRKAVSKRPAADEEEDIELLDPMLTMKMEVVEVPKKYMAKIIGKKGATLRLIRDETGAHVDARDQSQDPCQVKVLGSLEAIEAAKMKIADIMEVCDHKPGLVLEIPRAKIGKVIGIRGAQIHEIQTTTGAKVDVDKDVDPCKVIIGGDDVQIALAEKVILTLAMEAADGESEYLDLPSQVSGAVLGVRGARLMELQATSGARIDVDKTRPATCRVRIAGTPEQRELAKQLVLLATEAPRPTEASLPPGEGRESQPNAVAGTLALPPGTASKIIGRSGATLRSVQTDSGARVWVDPDANEVRFAGQPNAVEHAKMLVQALADEAEAELLHERACANSPGPPAGAISAEPARIGTDPLDSEANWENWDTQAWDSNDWFASTEGAAGQGAESWEQPGGIDPMTSEWAEEESWTWSAGHAEVPQQDSSAPSTGKPRTAMQQAFARLAAKSGRAR